jgi:hypothetical protein
MPWAKGESGNPGGRRKDPLLQALRSKVTPAMAQDLMGVLLERANAGDMKAMEMLWDRMAGKAIARNEQGEPGAFSHGYEIRLVRVEDDGDAQAS